MIRGEKNGQLSEKKLLEDFVKILVRENLLLVQVLELESVQNLKRQEEPI